MEMLVLFQPVDYINGPHQTDGLWIVKNWTYESYVKNGLRFSFPFQAVFLSHPCL